MTTAPTVNIYELFSSLKGLTWEAFLESALLPLGIMAAAFVIGLILNKILSYYLKKHMNPEEMSMRLAILQAMRGLPLAWFMGTVVYFLLNSTDINYYIAGILSSLTMVILALTVIQVIARAVTGTVDVYAFRNEHLPRTTLLHNVLNIFIYSAGILLILGSLGISVAPLITALGIGGMAVALGLQETLANICAGLYLLMSRQLHIGDYIRLSSGEEGKVEDITWRFTTILSISGNAIVVPNKQISSAIITNYCMPEPDLAIKIHCGVAYDSDLEQVEQVTLDVAREIMLQVDGSICNQPAVRFHTFNDSSIDFDIILHCSQFTNQFTLKHEFIKALTARYRQEGINIRYPIRTIVQQ